jgi:hypothetical protein
MPRNTEGRIALHLGPSEKIRFDACILAIVRSQAGRLLALKADQPENGPPQ